MLIQDLLLKGFKRGMRNRILSIVLSLLLIIGMIPATVSASENDFQGNEVAAAGEAAQGDAAEQIDTGSIAADAPGDNTVSDGAALDSVPSDGSIASDSADAEANPAESVEPASSEENPAESVEPASSEVNPAESVEPASSEENPAESVEPASSEENPVESVEPASSEENPAESADPASSEENPAESIDPAASEENPAESAESGNASSSEESEAEEETLFEELAVTEVSLSEGYYRIASMVDTSFVLDIYGGSAANGANVQLYKSNNSPAQIFKLTPVTAGGKTRYRISPVSAMSCSLAADGTELTGNGKVNAVQKSASNTAAQQWYFSKGTNGGYRIHSNLAENYVLDVYAGKAKNKANIWIYKSNNSKAQEFKLTKVGGSTVADGLYTLRSKTANGKVMDIYGNQLTNNANVQIYNSNGSAAQKFWIEKRPDGYFRIRGYASGMSMDIENSKYANGTNIQLFMVKDVAAQKFVLEDTGAKVGGKAAIFIKSIKGQYVEPSGTNVQLGSTGGYWLLEKASETQLIADGMYSIRTALKNTMYVDIYGGSRAAGAKADIYTGNNSNAQKFIFKYSSSGTTMQAQQSGMYLTNTNGTAANSNKVTQQSGTGTAAKWKLVPTGDGTGSYYIQYAANTNYQLDVYAGKSANGTQVDIYKANTSNAQKWFFRKTTLKTGWQYYLGKYRYLTNTSGSYYTNIIWNGYFFKADGTAEHNTKTTTIQSLMDAVYQSKGRDLWAVYQWACGMEYKENDSANNPGGYTSCEWFGYLGLRDYYGQCENYASAFVLLARGLGYDAHLMGGAVATVEGSSEHFWIEIDEPDGTWVYDPFLMSTGTHTGYHFKYGDSKTYIYLNNTRME